MSQNSDNLKKIAMEHSNKLASIGEELSKIKFSYKIQENTSKEYWKSRIEEFKKYTKKGLEYYNQAYSLMNMISKEESQIFLLRVSKLRKLGLDIIETMKRIEDNPSIMDSKDKQQSQWSKELKKQITEQSNKCLIHEKEMNSSFREFYEKQLKEII